MKLKILIIFLLIAFTTNVFASPLPIVDNMQVSHGNIIDLQILTDTQDAKTIFVEIYSEETEDLYGVQDYFEEGLLFIEPFFDKSILVIYSLFSEDDDFIESFYYRIDIIDHSENFMFCNAQQECKAIFDENEQILLTSLTTQQIDLKIYNHNQRLVNDLTKVSLPYQINLEEGFYYFIISYEDVVVEKLLLIGENKDYVYSKLPVKENYLPKARTYGWLHVFLVVVGLLIIIFIITKLFKRKSGSKPPKINRRLMYRKR